MEPRPILFKRVLITIREYRDTWYHLIDCQPVGQRLPIQADALSKARGIVRTILQGIDIGQITLTQSADLEYDHESLDGGHRKRDIWNYLQNKFMVDGKFFKQLSLKVQEAFLDSPLQLIIYGELSVQLKGHIFRTLNKTTDVNFIEKLNSYGDILMANLVRELTRTVSQVDNICHELFDFSYNTKGEPLYRHVKFDNDRLRQDLMVARIVFRYTQDILLGGSSDLQLEKMYNSDFTEAEMVVLKKKLKEHLNFLLKCANWRRKITNHGLTQQEFKALSLVYLYLQDTYKKFKIKDYEVFYKAFKKAFSKLADSEGPYAEIKKQSTPWDKEPRFINEAFKGYLGAPGDNNKTIQIIRWLLLEFDPEKVITIQDSKRGYTRMEKEIKLAQQDYNCGIDDKKLSWEDAHAAHMIAHDKGGLTTMENLVMVRAIYNKDMGTMSVEEFKKTLTINF